MQTKYDVRSFFRRIKARLPKKIYPKLSHIEVLVEYGIPKRCVLRYTDEEFDDIRTMKGGGVPHNWLKFDKTPLMMDRQFCEGEWFIIKNCCSEDIDYHEVNVSKPTYSF